MPSQYYKLRGVEGVSGGQFTDTEVDELGVRPRRREPSLTDSFNQRVVGSRFQEMNRDSSAFGRLPIGHQLILEKNGQMGPARLTESPLPETAPYHPQRHTSWDTAAFNEGFTPQQEQQWWTHQDSLQEDTDTTLLGEEWVDVLSEAPEAFQNQEDYNTTTPPRRRPRPPRANKVTTNDDRRETFPLRNRGNAGGEDQPPPHLRVQPRAPFVRPLSGLDHEDLGEIYEDIRSWRTKLKSINEEIANVQRDAYSDIADGVRVKGWLLVGRGLRHLPGIQLIEGRAKEDIRWDELQNEGNGMRTTMFWLVITVVAILLGVGSEFACCMAKLRRCMLTCAVVTAVAGLSVATAPEYAHYLPFFLPLSTGNNLGAGVSICLAAAIAMTLFMAIGLYFIQCE